MTIGRRRIDLARGALLGTFAGDALGMPFEGLQRTAIPAQLDMRDGRLPRGSYTDDTQMMIALAESLLERGAVDPDDLAHRFLQAFHLDRGYGGGTRQVLELWVAGTPVREAAGRIFGGEGSRGNGAAMRVAPVAVLFADDPPRLRSEAVASARLTHAHPVGVDGAVVQAAAIGAALRGRPILVAAQQAAATGEMRAGLRDVAGLVAEGARSEKIAREVGSSFDARESVCAAICSAVASASFEQAVTSAVRLGGDTDTVAAMAGAVAGARDGAASIPARWLQALEDGERGRRHVQHLADRLATTG